MSSYKGKKHGTGLVSVLSLALVLIDVTQAGAKVDNRISGGIEAYPGEFPFMVSLFRINEHGIAKKFCGGSIIDEHHILTAAHCVRPKLVAKLGCHKLSECSNDYEISTSWMHPLYDGKIVINDIAILKTEEPMDFTGLIGEGSAGIIDLPEVDDLVDDESLTVIGWGLVDPSNDSDVLMKLNVSTIDWLECRKVFPMIVESQMCAGSMKRDSCSGDSGGPLFRTSGRNRHTLIGIVSRGAVGAACGHDSAGVYTRVASYIEWIEWTILNSYDW